MKPLSNKKKETINLESKACSSIRLKSVVREMVNVRKLTFNPRILAFISSDKGMSDYIRVASPILLNEKLKETLTFSVDALRKENDEEFNVSRRILEKFPVTFVIAREKIDSDSLEYLKEIEANYPNTKIIVDIDDDLFSISPSHPEYSHYKKRLNVLRELIRISDLVTVSTDKVKAGVEESAPYHPEIVVVPNYLDQRIWPMAVNPALRNGGDRDSIKVLYSGTETHDADLRIIEPLIPEVQREILNKTGKRLEICIAGGTSLEIKGMIKLSVPSDKRGYPDYSKWVQSIGPFDFAIAPLDIENKLNHAKSALKYLEYSALGLPCIFSDIEPYRKAVKNGVTGILVQNNDLGQWKQSLIRLAIDDRQRKAMSNAAFEDVAQNYLLSDHYNPWTDILE